MARIVIVGAGLVGLGAAALLARDGHQVTVLERDPQGPASSPDEAWERWERRGVNQFKLPHFFMARYRSIVESELPGLAEAVRAAGGLRANPLKDIPEVVRGPLRDGDADYGVITGRRPVMEAAVAGYAESTPGVEVRRGVAVGGLVLGSPAGGVPRVAGVRTEAGEEVLADLVVDMSGRRSALPRWMDAAGLRPPAEEVEDTGFIYYGRHLRSRDGALPVALGPGLQHYGTISSLCLPADNSTWAVTLVTSARDRALHALRDPLRWEAVVRSLPLVAHWLDGEPIDAGVAVMAKLEDRSRRFAEGGEPLATGVVAVADAWACSNPSLGRGASIGMIHAVALRDTLREVGVDDPLELARAFVVATAERAQPWFEATLAFDRHRVAEIDAGIEGRDYRPADPAWETGQALACAAMKDPDCLRAFVGASLLVRSDAEALGEPGVAEKVEALGAAWRDEPVLGPSRDELVQLAAG